MKLKYYLIYYFELFCLSKRLFCRFDKGEIVDGFGQKNVGFESFKKESVNTLSFLRT